MQSEESDPSTRNEAFSLRTSAMKEFASSLPLKGVDARSNRLVTIWGESQVGKTSFITSFRESDYMLKSKVLWLQPTRDSDLDTIPEFIKACSETVRYPASPEKEKEITQRLESVERGKVNPVVSDDSILITRSDVAKRNKPYINQAAASSVGRTDPVRDDIEVNVGLGESKASNHAEGFLDALPLQSLGTDLTILFIENLDRLSISIQDWLRDYVVPAATRGAYRRNLILIFESKDPLQMAYPNMSWGEWDNHSVDLRIHPLSESETYKFALNENLLPPIANLVYTLSLGYPAALAEISQRLASKKLSDSDLTLASDILDNLEDDDKAKVACLCLSPTLYSEDLVLFFGSNKSSSILQWVCTLDNFPIEISERKKAISLPEGFRLAVLSSIDHLSSFKIYKLKWTALGRLHHNSPNKTSRSKLLLLSGLRWFDSKLCHQLFGEQAYKILSFAKLESEYFCRNEDRYCISERLKAELQKVAQGIGHIGVGSVRKKAETLWEKRRNEIEESIDTNSILLEEFEQQIAALNQKQNESTAQLRILERNTHHASNPPKIPEGKNKGPLALILILAAATISLAGAYLPEPFEIIAYSSAVLSLFISLCFIPNWLAYRKFETFERAAAADNSPEHAKKINLDIIHKIHSTESKLDEVKREIANAKDLLNFPYV